AEPRPNPSERYVDGRIERHRGHALAIDHHLELPDRGAGAEWRDQRMPYLGIGLNAAGLAARHHDIDIARRAHRVVLLAGFEHARLEYDAAMLFDAHALVEGVAVVQQRGARILASLDVLRAQHYSDQTHILAQCRGDQAIAGAVGMAGLHAIHGAVTLQ